MINIFESCDLNYSNMDKISVKTFDEILLNMELIGNRVGGEDKQTIKQMIFDLQKKMQEKDRRLLKDYRQEEINLIQRKNERFQRQVKNTLKRRN